MYQLYIDAMELEAQERETFVRTKCKDKNILAKVLSLLSTDKFEFTLSDHIAKESDLYKHQNTAKVGDTISVYQLTESLGQGGMGSVFKAQRIDGRFEQTVAIKVISPLLSPFFDTHKLLNEANFMAKLNHNNICTVFDAGSTEEGIHYVVMEYLDGNEISSYFADQSITLSDKLSVFTKLCDAVNYAHQMQVVHGDLKPANILINENHQIKVLDFGISQVINSPYNTTQESNDVQFHGISKGFASPELINGDKPSVYSDVYALGCILANLLEQSKESGRGLYRELEAIIHKAKAFLAVERYASASEFQHDINLLLAGHVAPAYQSSNIYRLKKFIVNRHPLSVSTGLIFAICLSALATNLVIQYQNLAFEKQQTDVMLEKFSLVLDLDFDRQSNVELSLAKNYQSRFEYDKAALLYNKIIDRFDKLTDKDIAFDAGSKLIDLMIHNDQIEQIESTLAPLKSRLRFIPGSALPDTAAQAMFYNYLINTSDDRDSKTKSELYLFHIALMKQIKSTYWQQLSNKEKSWLNYSLLRGVEPKVPNELQHSFYYQPESQNKLLVLFSDVKNVISENLYPEDPLAITEQQVKNFIEYQPIIFSGTHMNEVENEAVNKASFSQGVTKFEEMEGLYRVSGNQLIHDFGEGEEFDSVIYLSSSLALTVPVSDGDLILFTYDDISNENNHQPWIKEQLLETPWYHIYDRSLNKNDAITPSLMEINYSESNAQLMNNDLMSTASWGINSQGLLELRFENNDSSILRLIKVREDENMIIAKNPMTGVFSLFMKDEKLAKQILSSWKSFL